MGEFNWTPERERRTSQAVRSHNAAITRRERELHDAGRDDLIPALPDRVTVDEVRGRIDDVNDFRRIVGYRNDAAHGRPSELDRILKKVDPHALDFDPDAPYPRTYYDSGRERRASARLRRQERQMRDVYERYHDVGSMSAPGLGAALDGSDLLDELDEGEWDQDYTDWTPDEKARAKFEDLLRKADQDVTYQYGQYRGNWEDPYNMHAAIGYRYQDMLDALDWLLVNDRDGLILLFASGRDEIEPDYIYIGWRDNPYAGQDYEGRHKRAVDYVTSFVGQRKAELSGARNDDEDWGQW